VAVDEFFFFPDHGATCRIFPTDAKPGTNTFKKPLHCFIHTTNEHNEQLAEFSPQMPSQVKNTFKNPLNCFFHHQRTQGAACRIFPTDAKPGKIH
jgi:hypothetical protein